MNKRNLKLSQNFLRKYRKLRKASAKKYQFIKTALLKFENGEDATLRIHKLSGKYSGHWSFDVGYDLRVIYSIEKDGTMVIHNLEDLGTHSELYGI